jgi:hypothetical protein
MLVHLTTGVCLLRMIDELVHVAFQRPVATGGVRIHSTARVPRNVGRLLYRLDREILDSMQNDGTRATDPRDDRRSVFVILPPARFALLTTTTRLAPQCLRPAVLGLAFVASRMRQFSRLHRALQLTIGFVGDGCIP